MANNSIGRRRFLGAAGAGGLALLRPQAVRGSAANSAIRLGLLGCGGRGTHVTSSFVKHTGARVTALADLFQDQLDKAKNHFDAVAKEFGHATVDREHLYQGPRAFEALAHSGAVDVIYIATPIYFHPEHFEAAVAGGKHVYLEKPVAVDVPGVKRVLQAAEKARGKKSVTVGLQLRYATPYVELMKRVHAGEAGEIVTGLVHYFASALDRPEWPRASEKELRLRNWVWDKKLSGDIVVEQNVHVIDVTNWALRSRPARAAGVAGRKGREDPGDCSSHYNCTFWYPGGAHISFASTQFIKSAWDVGMRYFGTRATAEAYYSSPVRLRGETEWAFPGLEKPAEGREETQAAQAGAFQGALDDADEQKQKAFIDSIRNGKPLYEVEYGCESTLSAILARMAAEKGDAVSWDEMMRSGEVWDPQLDLSRLG